MVFLINSKKWSAIFYSISYVNTQATPWTTPWAIVNFILYSKLKYKMKVFSSPTFDAVILC